MTLNKVAEIIAERIGKDVSEITPDTKIEDLGLDSLDVAELMMQFEDEFGYEIELGENKAETVGDLVLIIENAKK